MTATNMCSNFGGKWSSPSQLQLESTSPLEVVSGLPSPNFSDLPL